MLYDKKLPSLKDKIIEDAEELVGKEIKDKKQRGISRASVKKTRKKSKKK